MHTHKMVVMGSAGVGKSALTIRFVNGRWVDRYDPTIEDSYRKQITYQEKQNILEILDTAGTEQFTAMRDLYMKNGEGFVVVYSVVDRQSFEELDSVYKIILRVKEGAGTPMIVVGNKIDLASERQVKKEEGEELVSKWENCLFIEASAKTETNVSEIFENLTGLILEKKGVGKRQRSASKADKADPQHKKKLCLLY